MNEENEIDSYELKEDEHYGQHERASTLMDRYEDDPHDDPAFTEFIRNRKPSTGWVLESEGAVPEPKPIGRPAEEEESSFVTELDVNSDLIGQRKLSTSDDEERRTPDKRLLQASQRPVARQSRSDLINELPVLYDQLEQPTVEPIAYPMSKSVLSLEQLDSLATAKKSAPFALDTDISLMVLAKYLAKDGQALEPDIAWTYDSLITEMADRFKNL